MTNPSRRGLFGLLAGVAAAPVVGWGAGARSSPLTHTLVYGVDYAPMTFSGFSSEIPTRALSVKMMKNMISVIFIL